MSENKTTVIKGGCVLDGTGKKPAENMAVVVEDGHITSVIEEEQLSRVVDGDSIVYKLDGEFVLPGFIDGHTHIQLSGKRPATEVLTESVPKKTARAVANARATLESGFTTIRDLGAEYLVDLGVRDAINERLIAGPRMFVSGYKIMPTGADFAMMAPEVNVDGWYTMDTPGEIKKAVRTLIARDVDVIKVMTSGRTFRKNSSPDASALSLDDTRLVVEEAHNQNKKVSAHVHGRKGVKIAIEAGCDSLEHGTVLDDEDVEAMVEKGIFLVPTFSYGKRIEILGETCGLPSYAVKKALDSRKQRLESFSRALKAGVNIAMGTDAGMPLVNHGDNAFELVTMIEAGMTYMQAVQSMTIRAAELLGQSDRIGSIEPGKFADLVIVDGNPLKDISVLCDKEKIKGVFKEGEIVAGKTFLAGKEK